MTLEDGIYARPEPAGPRSLHFLTYVRSGLTSIHIGSRDGLLNRPESLPISASTWIRVADLPDLRMPEPTQTGYPVMADCGSIHAPHVHTRVGRHLPWTCEHNIGFDWRELTDPRDLTPDEIREHNLWSGTT